MNISSMHPANDLAILRDQRSAEMAVADEAHVLPVSVRQADGHSESDIYDMCGLPEETSVAELARLVETDPFRVAMHIVTLEGRVRLLEQRLSGLSARVGA